MLKTMYRAFTGALALTLALVVLNWFLPELLQAVVEVAIKMLHFLSALLDSAINNIAVQ